MVSFSCEVCNDTVIKKKLDQHARQCYGAYFTCIDCSTTFSGYDYRNHTQCISEAEKYEKALYKGNKQQKKTPNKVELKKEEAKPELKKEAKPELKKESKPELKKEKTSKKKDVSLSKYYKKDETLYKIVKKVAKDQKKSTKDILKDLKVVKNGDSYVLEF